MPTIPVWSSPYKWEQTKPTHYIVRCRCGREVWPYGKTHEEAIKYARALGWTVDDDGSVYGCIHRR